ncbi:MAG: ferrochelatase [Xanthomonadales bacterium]|nr:ferrochelatase [Xanthomonadales bacterium]
MKGVLLINLGTPKSPDPQDVGRYLNEFLSDPRVVDLPRWLWLPLLKLVIVPLRRRRSAEAYASIWTPEGSPLLVETRRLAERLQAEMDSAVVDFAMRYGEPGIRERLERMRGQRVEDLVIIPLYPQFSDTTTRTVLEAVDAALRDLQWFPRVRTIEKYHDHPAWVEAIAGSIRRFQSEHGKPDKLLFSLHGIPQRYAEAGDPYRDQCEQSVLDIARALGLSQQDYMLTYQSRVGREPWLQPYTDKTLKAWAKGGVGTVQVVCPGFAVDCLETLEEIAVENREYFEEGGGKSLQYIPALNDSPEHVALMKSLAVGERG